ncbi:MAG: sulfurtransferase TusA family protein [Betaproteobacteria bacterium]
MVDSSPSSTRTIDLRGVHCPISTIRLKKILKTLVSKQVLSVVSDDNDARVDFPGVIKKSGASFVFIEKSDGTFEFEVTKE